MKSLRLHILLSFVLGMFAISAVGQVTDITNLAVIKQGTLPSEGEWIGGKVNATTVTVTLTGTVEMKGPIVIPKGKTLIIKKDPALPANSEYATINMSRQFSVPSGSVHCMFEVQAGGKLIIEGNDLSNNFIAIKGNSGLETPALPNTDSPTQEEIDAYLAKVDAIYTTATTPRDGHKFYADPTGHPNDFLYDFRGEVTGTDSEGKDEYRNAGAVLYVVGTLEMRHAKIACAFSRDDGAAIKRPVINYLPSDTEFGTVTLDNIQIRCCLAQSGPALIIFNQKNGSAGSGNTPSSCKTTISNSQIYRNYSRSSSVNGTVRTGGGVVGDLELTNVNIYQNYGCGYGAGLVAAGQGLEATTSKLNGCKIHGNHSKTYAGGVLFTGSFLFTGSTTTVYKNTAGTYGGGVHVVAYNGVNFKEPKELSMKFNNKLNVYSNTAQWGGGMCFNMRNKTSLEPGSTINLDIDGVNVHDNTATKKGGGIFLSYNNTGLNINLNINSGTIADNVADTYGGGLYCQVAAIDGEDAAENIDISKCKVKLNGGTISGNTVTNGSGGGVAVYDMPIYCDEGVSGVIVHSNKALNKGGGLFVEGAQFFMNSGQVYGNECLAASESGEGGGIYLKAGASMTIAGGTIGGASVDKANKAYNAAGIMVFNSTLVMKDKCTVSYNQATNNAGGIYVKDASTFTFNKGTISNNTASVYGGAIYVGGCDSFSITDGEISNNTSSTSKGGAIYLTANAKNVSFSGGNIMDNHADNGNGGGIYVHGSNGVKVTGGVISGNNAIEGGGIFVEDGTITISGGDIKSNTGSRGAGIRLDAAAGLTLDGGYFAGNTSVNEGGALFLGGTSTCTFSNGAIGKTSSGEVLLNKASKGGGLYLDGGSLDMSGGEITSNEAAYGGGVYVYATPKLQFQKECLITNNKATSHGGGIYVYAGTDIKFSDGEVSHNEAVEGGGLYANGGTIAISGGDLVSNSASLGGGIRLNGSANLTFTGGNVSNNTADNNGGGFYTGGNSVTTFSNGNVTDNTAANGGGIYMMYYSKMTFSNGIIRDNYAKATGTGYGTAYQNDNVRGAGGGLFLKDNAQFEFVPNSSVGIFNNIADMAGDDLVVGSANAQVVLPDVSNMVLTGYNSKTSELYWVEDYMTDDTKYDSGTKGAGAGHKAVRYRNAVAAQTTVYKVPAGTYKGKYLALSIGHEILYVTLKKVGLQPGESAMFRISRIDDGVPSVYSELLMTGVAGGAEQTRKVALYSGTWKVEELPWTWSYDPVATVQREITGSSTAEQKAFTFVNTKNSDLPLHAEDIVVNDFGAGAAVTGSYLNSGSINDLQNTTDYQLQ